MSQYILRKFTLTFIMVIWALLSLDIFWPLLARTDDQKAELKLPGTGGINFLIIAPKALSQSATAWADYRSATGYQTRAILLAPDRGKVDTIREIIQQVYTESEQPTPFFVLLIGHAHPSSSHPEAFLPAPHFSVDPSQFSGYGDEPIPSDDGYISASSQGIINNPLPIFIGRIPARTEEEGLLLLERTRTYEENPPVGSGRLRIELITSNAGFGPQYDPLFAWAINTLIQDYLPLEYQWHLLSGNPDSPYSYPVDEFPQEVTRRLSSGALAAVYIGHGQPDLLGWAYSSKGERTRVFNGADAASIQNAQASLAIFTACSAGQYDLEGDDLSVVESIYLSPAGPVAAYSSSSWINGVLNGRLVIDIFESLLIDHPATLGEWAGQVEAGANPIPGSHTAFTWALRSIIPRISGAYEQKLFLSPAAARQVLAIQHASYNLFGDPALKIAYLQPGIDLTSSPLWEPWEGTITLSGKSNLATGQPISLTLETLPGRMIGREEMIDGADRYEQANNPVVISVVALVRPDGSFSANLTIPSWVPSGHYLIRAVAISGSRTISSARSIYLGWAAILEIPSSKIVWWLFISAFLLFIVSKRSGYENLSFRERTSRG